MNYNKTLEYIHSLGNFGKTPTLNRIKCVLEKLENPQNDFKSIHIAGTNGKGSVSAMLNCVFKEAGYKTGLFISPFIIDFRERIQIDGEFISQNSLCELSREVMATNVSLTEFEFITAVAFLYFSRSKCDIAIVETGLGGRLDATNSLEKVMASVITKIGLDHTAILGNSIEKITKEKCGIIKNAPVITGFNQTKSAMKILKEYRPVIPDKNALKILKSDIFGNEYIYKGEIFKTKLAGEYQIENSLIALETAVKCGIDVSTVKSGIEKTFFPARMELISEKPLVLLDGAHNPDGAFMLAQTMKKYSGKITAVIGMCADKDIEEVLKQTLCYCRRVVVTEICGVARSVKAEALKKTAEKYCRCEIATDYNDAIEKIKNDDVVFIFGSLYLASGIRDYLKIFFK